MFEFSIAWKYLIPRWRQLSVSIISLISVLVISLVVWLIIVFFSVTFGLEKVWTDKLIGLTAPVRINPTDDYYRSYYYMVDTISSASNYTPKSISEKLQTEISDPYVTGDDEELPTDWPKAHLHNDGSLIDPVKLAYQEIQSLDVPGVSANDYEVTFGNIHLRLFRESDVANAEDSQTGGLSQGAYLASFDGTNPWFQNTLLKVTASDVENLLHTFSREAKGERSFFIRDMKNILSFVQINQLSTPSNGWKIPLSILPQKASWIAYALQDKEGKTNAIFIPFNASQITQLESDTVQSAQIKKGVLNIEESSILFTEGEQTIDASNIPLELPSGLAFPVELIPESVMLARSPSQIKFKTEFDIQGTTINGTIPMKGLSITSINVHETSNPDILAPWAKNDPKNKGHLLLPKLEKLGHGVLLPKGYREAGVMIGDQGEVVYQIPTASSMQEQRVPIYIAGFYDHGILPIGGKMVLLNKDIVSLIRSSYEQNDSASAGINVRFDDISQAPYVKASLQEAFKKAGIDRYWTVSTYREYEFTKDILQQLSSEHNLFTLVSIVIILVACSNIISMLIIMVNDKKVEIGILRAMGANFWSISMIFGTCGIVMGLTGSIFGILMAVTTLNYLQPIVDFIGRVQGYEMFNSLIYGERLPNEISLEALSFVLVATCVISLLAGIVPAIKACMLRPSAILRAE